MKKLFSIMSNLQTYYHFKTRFSKKWTNIQEASAQPTAPNTTRTIRWSTWNSPVEYPIRESKHDTKECECNMFNPIFKGNVQWQKHPRRCTFVELELLAFRKPKCVIQNKKHTILLWQNQIFWSLEVNSGLGKFYCLETGPGLNIKTVLSTYGDFHVKDKTAVRTSYL